MRINSVLHTLNLLCPLLYVYFYMYVIYDRYICIVVYMHNNKILISF